MKKLLGKLGGRKWLISLISILLVGLSKSIGLELSPEAVLSIAGIAAAMVLGQGLADGLSNGATSTTTPDPKPEGDGS